MSRRRISTVDSRCIKVFVVFDCIMPRDNNDTFDPISSSRSNDYYCEPCSKSFASRGLWNEHKLGQGHSLKSADFYKVVCDVCHIELPSREAFNEHRDELTHRRAESEMEVRKQENSEDSVDLPTLQASVPCKHGRIPVKVCSQHINKYKGGDHKRSEYVQYVPAISPNVPLT